MISPDFHFFICNSYRVSGEPKGVCTKKDASSLLQYLETEILDRGMDGVVSSTGCLKMCDHGPVMVLYPQGKWFGEVNEEKLDAILDALEDGEDTSEFELA
jgi:(2Fe-2S) ferredoxin